MPTTASWGRHSYMLRDALRGLIRIPPGVVSEEHASNEVWECTRLVISDRMATHADRSRCLSLLLRCAIDMVRERQGRDLISLSPLPLVRTLRQLGFPVQRVGEPYSESDGRRYAMLRMPVLRPPHDIAAE